MAAAAAQAIVLVGAGFTQHLTMDPDATEYKIGVRIAAPISARGRVEAGRLAAEEVARAIYHALQGPRLCLGRVRCLDHFPRGTRPRPRPLGVLRRGT